MLRSFIVLSVRNLIGKNKLFTLINVIGLSISLTSLLLILLFITDEYSFDKFHGKADRIYRIVTDFTSDRTTDHWAKTSAPVGQFLRGAYPEVEEVVRLRKNPGTDLLALDDAKFYEEKLFFADSDLFNVFDFRLVKGNPKHALSDKNSIVLSADLAKKYFSDKDPIGQSLRFNNVLDLKVTGIMDAVSANSHFVADAFISFSSLNELLGEQRLTHWGQFDHYTYVLLTEGSEPKILEQKLSELIKKNAPDWVSEKEKLFLQPLTSIHFESHLKDEITPNSKESYSKILGTIGLAILIMAAINFVNLSTATHSFRLKEIAVQKMLGANRTHLASYFLAELFLVCLCSLLLAWLMTAAIIPSFNTVTAKYIQPGDVQKVLIPVSVVTLAISVLASIVTTIQSWKVDLSTVKYQQPSSKNYLRSGLIAFQLTTSIVLVIITLIVSAQFDFLNCSRLNFTSDNIIVIPIKDRSQNSRYATLINEINSIPGVKGSSFSSSMPGNNNALTYTYTIVDSEASEQPLTTFLIDENFIELYEIEIVSGKSINPINSDTLSDVLINEAAVKKFGLKEPIGQVVTGKVKGRIVGVVKDFNHSSLHASVDPLIMYMFKPTLRFVSVKLDETDQQSTIGILGEKWPEMYPGYPLEFSFLDDQIKELYSSESKLSNAYRYFAVIAIIIAGVGLVGLISFLMTRKQKEIGIRKVFGGTISQLLNWIYSGFTGILILSIFLSWIIAFFWMEDWLNEFAFRIKVSIGQFVVPTVIVIGILLIMTGFQTVKAARTNPVDSLRQE